jgi:hypothetical protein
VRPLGISLLGQQLGFLVESLRLSGLAAFPYEALCALMRCNQYRVRSALYSAYAIIRLTMYVHVHADFIYIYIKPLADFLHFTLRVYRRYR